MLIFIDYDIMRHCRNIYNKCHIKLVKCDYSQNYTSNVILQITLSGPLDQRWQISLKSKVSSVNDKYSDYRVARTTMITRNS